MEKLIITAAVVGSLTTREQNPGLPHTPQEIAKASVDSWKAGASVVHLHVRDPLTGKAVHKVELFKETIALIRKECDVIINTSTGGGPGMTPEERIAVVPGLAVDPIVKQEIASLNCGSLNYGMLSRKQRKFFLNDVQMNPWETLLKFADIIKEYGVKPELEVYDSAMINNVMVLLSIDALKEPLHFQFVLGILGGMQPTVENVVFLKSLLPRDATWSVCAVDLSIYTVAPVAIAAGGHVRVGLEDCIRIEKGVLAESSAQMVAKMRHISEQLGRDVATPAEARKILSLS
jgi:3-keto-5-aminohexanoate cleavage enzyme